MKKPVDFIADLCNEHLYNVTSVPTVMLFCAHPDDEVISSGVLLNYLKEKIEIVTVTDGAPRSMSDALAAGFSSREAYSKARLEEQLRALQSAGINEKQCYHLCFTDQESSYHMAGICYRIMEMLELKKPELILTHAYEGGHPDHDSTAFAVWAACTLMEKRGNSPPDIIEYASYHGNGEAGMVYFEFIPFSDTKIWTVNLNEKELDSKKRMIDCYKTQYKTLSSFPLSIERYRKMPKYNFKLPPHRGILLYEYFDWGMSAKKWNKLAVEAINLLGINDFHD